MSEWRGLPSSSAGLPTSPLHYDINSLQKNGLPSNMCILNGFPATPNSTASTLAYPFGIWFADDNTIHVADEGDGYTGGADLYTHAAAQTTAGLQKWVFDSTAKRWNLAYTLQAGLGLGSHHRFVEEHRLRGSGRGTIPSGAKRRIGEVLRGVSFTRGTEFAKN